MTKQLGFMVGAILCIHGLTACGQATQSSENVFKIVKYNHPGAVVDLGVGLWAHPLPMDYDHDGKMDLLVSSAGTPYNGIYFFKNLTGGKAPVFDTPIRLSGGLPNVEISYVNGKPVLLVPGARLKSIWPVFNTDEIPLYPRDSILHDIKKIRADQWKLVDFDGDGTDDLIVGAGEWGDYGWDNAYDSGGHWKNGPLHGYVYLLRNREGHFENKVKLTTVDGHPIDVFGAPSPNFCDFDGDGDLDLICGSFLDKLTWYENIGSARKPVYAKGRLLSNEKGVIHMPLEMMNVTAIDWDHDGDIDLVIGQEDGRVALLEHTGHIQNHMPVFKSPVFFKQKAGDLKFGVLSTPFAVDWDGDGNEDLICGNSAGNIAWIRNLGGDPPRWGPPKLLKAGGQIIRIMAGKNGSIQGPAEAKWGYTTLTVADWDRDGIKDLIVNSIWGKVVWYKNIGTKDAPKLAAAQPIRVDWPGIPQKPVWNWWNPHGEDLVTQWRTTPYALDWNKDGKMDLIMLDDQGYLCYFKRLDDGNLASGKRLFYGTTSSGFDTNHKITRHVPGLLQLNTGKNGGSGRRKFCFVDWDQDGKMDLLVNSENVTFMKNMGIRGDTVYFENKGPLTRQKFAGHTTSPTVVDWNRDGVPDLLIGAEDGHFYYLQNRHSSNKMAQ